MESVYNMMDAQSQEIIGPTSRRYLSSSDHPGLVHSQPQPLGLIPLESPTAVPAAPLGCAVVTWCYYQGRGPAHQWLGDTQDSTGAFCGWRPPTSDRGVQPPGAHALAHRPSLANMFAGDRVTLVFFSLIPVVLPVTFMVPALRRRVDSDLDLRVASDGVHRRGSGARALAAVWRRSRRRPRDKLL